MSDSFFAPDERDKSAAKWFLECLEHNQGIKLKGREHVLEWLEWELCEARMRGSVVPESEREAGAEAGLAVHTGPVDKSRTLVSRLRAQAANLVPGEEP